MLDFRYGELRAQILLRSLSFPLFTSPPSRSTTEDTCSSLLSKSSLSASLSPLPPQSLYVATSCQLRRLESASYSSVCSHMAETFQGSPVVRAFQAQGPFTAQHDALMDENQRVSFPRLVADR